MNEKGQYADSAGTNRIHKQSIVITVYLYIYCKMREISKVEKTIGGHTSHETTANDGRPRKWRETVGNDVGAERAREGRSQTAEITNTLGTGKKRSFTREDTQFRGTVMSVASSEYKIYYALYSSF